jgi:hypothetical protein
VFAGCKISVCARGGRVNSAGFGVGAGWCKHAGSCDNIGQRKVLCADSVCCLPPHTQGACMLAPWCTQRPRPMQQVARSLAASLPARVAPASSSLQQQQLQEQVAAVVVVLMLAVAVAQAAAAGVQQQQGPRAPAMAPAAAPAAEAGCRNRNAPSQRHHLQWPRGSMTHSMMTTMTSLSMTGPATSVAAAAVAGRASAAAAAAACAPRAWSSPSDRSPRAQQ